MESMLGKAVASANEIYANKINANAIDADEKMYMLKLRGCLEGMFHR